MDRLKAAVVGCGRMGAYTRPELAERLPPVCLPLNHAEALLTINGIDLVAVCDTNENVAREAAIRWGARHVFTDYRTMVHEIRPDILTVATRSLGRADLIEFAGLNDVRGIHVEKPLCRNLDEGLRVVKAVENRVAFSYGAFRRYLSTYRRAREIVQSGELGKLRQVTVNFGRGRLMWLHPHSVDLIQFFADGAEVDWVAASLEIADQAFNGSTLDDDPIVNLAHIKFSSGLSGIITSTGGLDLHLGCDKGEVLVIGDGWQIQVNRPAQTNSGYFLSRLNITSGARNEGTAAAIRTLADNLIRKAPLPHSIMQALQGQNILHAMVLSEIKKGSRVALMDVDPGFTITGRQGDLYA